MISYLYENLVLSINALFGACGEGNERLAAALRRNNKTLPHLIVSALS